MNIKLIKSGSLTGKENEFYFVSQSKYEQLPISSEEMAYLKAKLDGDVEIIEFNRYSHKIFVHVSKLQECTDKNLEGTRQLGYKLHGICQENRITSLIIKDEFDSDQFLLALIEGLVLSNYQFIKYLSDTKKVKYYLTHLQLESKTLTKNQIEELVALTTGVKYARDLVNEPNSFLTANRLSAEFKQMGVDANFDVDILERQQIQSLKMGGLLAVNKGSIEDPTFSILEWNPLNKVNSKPIVFVGKGIVYDTGGLSLKPTKDSMDLMKSDMGGAAAVAGAMYAIAKSKIPVHVIGLVPATDNRPGGNAYAPGDIINMFNGISVEVLNTDAEGRLVLADALTYAKKYDPEFVIDLATLTGAAAVAIGKYGVVAMGNENGLEKMDSLKKAGNTVHERIVEFPFWEEYDELIKSDIADLKNIGTRDGGAITAGKFLEHFTDYPWIHIDIAGPAFLSAKDNYRGKGGTGVGVRLLFEFIKKYQS
ncbi:leucyl aminopeptidase family protein [Ancylomarina longa]|uniref:Probable cytosol aminopeptidase n=1 Tax=Ancylomarina longa TaxID=2487017 RepID=A0A434AG35_9BACT|nr:leucyl aminopeptidase [Ancylomarina longa]RUT73345.1 leucyl aminopeptidase [Ancylomarina longa]